MSHILDCLSPALKGGAVTLAATASGQGTCIFSNQGLSHSGSVSLVGIMRRSLSGAAPRIGAGRIAEGAACAEGAEVSAIPHGNHGDNKGGCAK